MQAIILTLMIILLLSSIFLGVHKKDFFYPLILYILPFFFQYFIYFILQSDMNGVNEKTLHLYILSILCFVLSYFFSELLISRLLRSNVVDRLPLKTKTHPFIFFIVFSLAFISILFEIYSYGFDSRFGNVYDAMAWHIDWGGGYNFIAKYVPLLYLIEFSVFVYNNADKKMGKKLKRQFILYTLGAFLFSFLTFSRTQIMQTFLVFIYIFMYRNRKKIFSNSGKILKYIKFIVMGSIILLVSFTIIAKLTNKMGNADIFNKNFYLWQYFSSQITVLDKYVINHPGESHGYYIMGFVSKLLGRSTDFKSFLPKLGEYNVFSYIGIVYLDCGNFSYIFQIILGIFVSIIYNLNIKKGGFWTIYYAFYSYAIFMSFYAYQYSLTTYIYILILFMFVAIINKISLGYEIKKSLL